MFGETGGELRHAVAEAHIGEGVLLGDELVGHTAKAED